jgi:hypothetical protein
MQIRNLALRDPSFFEPANNKHDAADNGPESSGLIENVGTAVWFLVIVSFLVFIMFFTPIGAISVLAPFVLFGLSVVIGLLVLLVLGMRMILRRVMGKSSNNTNNSPSTKTADNQ